MGDRYELNINCAYCKELNKDIYYAPTSNFDIFECEKCKKMNFITFNLIAKNIEELKYSDVEAGFLNSTNSAWTDDQIKGVCKERFKKIKIGVKK